MLNKLNIEDILIQKINLELENEGFQMRENHKLHYRKNFEGGFQSFLFTISSSPKTQVGKYFWIELSFGVRINIVEQIANQYTHILKDYYADTHTILTSYGRMVDQQYFRFKVHTQEELETACYQMRHFLKNTGLPFLQKNSDLQSIDKLINDYPEKPSKFIYNQSYRCIKGVIIAKLNQNPHFNTLTKAYEFILEQQSQGKDMMPRYLKLLEHLRLWSVN